MTSAALMLEFDPVLSVGGLSVRWQAVGVALAIAAGIVTWVRGLRAGSRTPVRADDVAFVLLGAIPGAVVGGRSVHGIVFASAYQHEPVALFDLGRGSLSLAGAVIGGLLTAGYVCRLLGLRVGAWADAAGAPLLLTIGVGKLAMVLGGAGQGAFSDAGWTLAFGGAGPWVSDRAPDAALPSQVLEGGWCLLGAVPVWLLARSVRRGPRAGRGIVLGAAMAWWLAGRALVALSWRDDALVGPMGAEGLTALGVLGATILVALLAAARRPAAAGSLTM